MTLPIKDTPMLTGEDARRFEQAIRANEKHKIPAEDYKRAMRNFRLIRIPER